MAYADQNFSYKGRIISSVLDQVELKEDAILDAFVEAQILERMGGLPIPQRDLDAALDQAGEPGAKQVKVLNGKTEQAKEKEKVRTRLWDLIAKNTQKYIEYDVSYNDNLFQTETAKSDIINEIKTGFKTSIVGVRHHLGLEANLTQYIHTHHPNENHSDIDLKVEGHRDAGQGGYNLYISDTFTTNYLSTPKTFGLSATAGTQSWQNNLYFSLAREFNRLSYDTGFLFSMNRYEAEYARDSDYNEYRYNLSTFFRVAPKTRLFFEYEKGFNRYVYTQDPSSNSDYQSYFFGTHGLLTGKLTGILKFGFRDQDYKTAQDFSETIFEGNLTHNLSDRTSFNFKFERLNHDSPDINENYYVENSFTLSGSHRFAFDPRLELDFSIGYKYDKYPKIAGETREDDLYNAILALGYRFRKWLSVQLTYEYDARRSNNVYDYDNNIFSIRTTATF